MAREDDEIALLNSLIRATMDSVEGYREAAEDVREGELKAHFAARATERLEVVTLLREQVQFLGGRPEDSGSALGGAHRVFTNLKAMVSGADDAAVLEEVRRGEKHLMKAFDEALETSETSLDTLDVIEEAHRQVASGYEKMVMLAPGAR